MSDNKNKKMISEYIVKVLVTANGKRPFIDWLTKLTDKKVQAAVNLRLERIKMGNFGLCKSLGNMVFELKIDIGPGYRIYFGKLDKQILLLLCAGDKKTQQKDIVRAKKYFQEFKKQD